MVQFPLIIPTDYFEGSDLFLGQGDNLVGPLAKLIGIFFAFPAASQWGRPYIKRKPHNYLRYNPSVAADWSISNYGGAAGTDIINS